MNSYLGNSIPHSSEKTSYEQSLIYEVVCVLGGGGVLT